MGQQVNLRTLGQAETFRLMGEDTENIARNYNGDSPVKEERHAVPAATTSSGQAHKKPDFSDRHYSKMTFDGPI